jgi:tetratricopeptide (TPR) repeat protein
MYSEMARAIADATQVNLTEEETIRLTNVRQVNPEAYEAYIQGRLHWYMLTPQDIETAMQHFESALKKDPNFALAHTGVALVWAVRGGFQTAQLQEAYSKAKEAAEKAMELDNTLAEAHYVMAHITGGFEWNWEGAERAYRRALELNPNFPDAHAYYSHFLSYMGRIDEALPHSERALELDPFNALFHGLYAVALQYHRRFDDSIAAARTGLALQPDEPISRSALQNAYIGKGMRDEQLAMQRARIALDPERLAAFERGFEIGGYQGAQREIADVLAARYGKQGEWAFGAHGIAVRYLDAGDYERAIEWLEKSFEEHSVGMQYLGLPLYDPLRSDPRFQGLLRRVGLPFEE